MPKAYTEETVRDAVFDIVENGLSVNKASNKYNMPISTLSDRVNGKHNSKQDPETVPSNALLSSEQERPIVSWILRQEKLGFALSHSTKREVAASIAKVDVGKKWVQRFINRHPEVATKVGRRQEAARFYEFTPRAVN